MQVVLEDHTADPEYRIGLSASECYDSKTEREACLKRAAHCVSSSHLATLRFAYATVRVSDISRVCSHQLVRVAHAGILQRSQRYVKETHVKYIDPPSLANVSEADICEWKQLQERATQLYLHLVDTRQMKKEDARYILPQGCSTSLRFCLNFQGWCDLLNNRDSNHAQWESRDVAQEIRTLLIGIAPGIFTK